MVRTLPAGMPTLFSRASSSSAPIVANAPSSRAITAGRLTTRSPLLAMPGASGSKPNSAHSRRHSDSFAQATCTLPSWQWNRTYGAMDGWWLPCARPTCPATVHAVPWQACTPTIAATSDVRTTSPWPVRSRASRAGRTAIERRGEPAVGPVHPGQQVTDRGADPLRVLRPRAGHRHQAALALGDLVVTGTTALRPVVPEPADRQGHQPRVELGEHVGAKAEPGQGAGAEVLEQDVGPAQQLGEQRFVAVVLEVEGDRLLVAVGRQEVGGLPIPGIRLHERRPPPAGVAPGAGALPLDHPGAEVAEHHRGVRPGEGAGQVDDEDAVERSGHAEGSFQRTKVPNCLSAPAPPTSRGAASRRTGGRRRTPARR